jgi:hypothetical protein
MSRPPRLDVSSQDNPIVPLADAVQEKRVDFGASMLDGEARPCSQEFEQVITQVGRVNA